jgi:subtilisin family serine protease
VRAHRTQSNNDDSMQLDCEMLKKLLGAGRWALADIAICQTQALTGSRIGAFFPRRKPGSPAMENKRNLILIGLLALLALTLGKSASGQLKEAAKVSDRIIVAFQAQRLPADAADLVQRAGGKVVSSLDEVGILVASPVLVDANTLIRNLRKDNAILDADYDLVLELVPPAQVSVEEENDLSPDTHFPHPLPTFSPALPPDFFYTSTPQQWSLKRVGAAGGGVPAPPGDPTNGAWDVTKGDGTKIAILDTGISPVHPDIVGNLVFNRALTFDIPDAFGTPNCEVPDASNLPFDLPVDQNGHGTWTSSLAAGQIGGGLMIGVAPEAKILNIKVLRDRPATPAELQQIGVPDTSFNRCQFRNGTGLFSWVLQGILLANQQGADIISMSLGGAVPRNIPGGLGAAIWSAFNRVTNFVTSRGSLVLAAAGNAATDLNRIGPVVVLPAESPHVIAVVATTNPMLEPTVLPSTATSARACTAWRRPVAICLPVPARSPDRRVSRQASFAERAAQGRRAQSIRYLQVIPKPVPLRRARVGAASPLLERPSMLGTCRRSARVRQLRSRLELLRW